MQSIIEKEFEYHGQNIKKAYFEGWYYKLTDTTYSLAVIVGINRNTTDDHAFIQTLDTVSQQEQYLRFPLTEVSITNTPLHIQIGNNHFYADRMMVTIDKEVSLQMDVTFEEFQYLQPTVYAPTIMGPFSYLSYMECVHSVYSLYHHIKGNITINQTKLSTKRAIGYMEKDRGTSFPAGYFWLQSNHIDTKEKASLFLSVATIPLKRIDFTGIIMVFLIGNQQLRFGSYYGARVQVIKKIKNHGYKIIIKQGKYLIAMKAYMGETFTLSAPNKGAMEHQVQETLTAKGSIRVYKNNRLYWNTRFTHAGCEVRGYGKGHR